MKAIEITLEEPMAEVAQRVREALATEGFGVLTEIDVAATLAAKLGVSRPGLLILGACNPDIVHRALGADPTVSLLLPCNVVLEETGTGTSVSAADPAELLSGDALSGVAEEASTRLRRVLALLAGAVAT